jgi:DnaJ homolog subfamily C member 28
VQRARPQGGSAGGTWGGLVEQRILDGMERGLFDNLPGMGRPLNLDEDQFVPEEMKMAFRMLRSTGLTPLWVQVNKEIREDIDRTGRFRLLVQERRDAMSPLEWAHRRREFAARIRDINDKIMNHNILAPSSQVHLPLLRLDEELARFDAIDDDANDQY